VYSFVYKYIQLYSISHPNEKGDTRVAERDSGNLEAKKIPYGYTAIDTTTLFAVP
jgi:hypothetical protein